MFSNYMLNKTSLQAKNIGFAICSTCTHIALTVGVLGGVQFGLLLPMDPTAHRCVGTECVMLLSPENNTSK